MAAASKAASIRNELEKDLLTCPICHETFTNPRVLSCQHAFCYRCLQGCMKVLKTARNVKINCAVCRRSTDVPKSGIAGIPKSFVIAGLMQITKKMAKKSESEEQKKDKPSASKAEKETKSCKASTDSGGKKLKQKLVKDGRKKESAPHKVSQKPDSICGANDTSRNVGQVRKSFPSNRKTVGNDQASKNGSFPKSAITATKVAKNVQLKDAKPCKSSNLKQVATSSKTLPSPQGLKDENTAHTSRIPIAKAKKSSPSSLTRDQSSAAAVSKPDLSRKSDSKLKDKSSGMVATLAEFYDKKAMVDENGNKQNQKLSSEIRCENDTEDSEIDSVYDNEFTPTDEDSSSFYDSSDSSDESSSYDDESSTDSSDGSSYFTSSSEYSSDYTDESSSDSSPSPTLQSCHGIKLNMKVCIFNKRGRKYDGTVHVIEKFVRKPPKQTCVYAGVQLERENSSLTTDDMADMGKSFLYSWLQDTVYPCAVVRIDQCYPAKRLYEYLK